MSPSRYGVDGDEDEGDFDPMEDEDLIVLGFDPADYENGDLERLGRKEELDDELEPDRHIGIPYDESNVEARFE
jgi:hypothetical protein